MKQVEITLGESTRQGCARSTNCTPHNEPVMSRNKPAESGEYMSPTAMKHSHVQEAIRKDKMRKKQHTGGDKFMSPYFIAANKREDF